MAQEDGTEQVHRKRRTLAEIQMEIDRLYPPSVGDDPSPENDGTPAGPPAQLRRRRRLVARVVTATVGALAISAVLMYTPQRRQEPQGQSKTPVTVTPSAAPESPVSEPPQPPSTDVASVPEPPPSTDVASVFEPGATSDDEHVLRESLDVLLAATNQRNLPGVIAFYPERMPRYYLARDVPREVVAADKAWQFRQAKVLDIRRIGDVALTIDPAGDAAVMRFTKRYVVTGPGLNRRGEALHELRWAKRETGWTIVSERDFRVRAGPARKNTRPPTLQ